MLKIKKQFYSLLITSSLASGPVMADNIDSLFYKPQKGEFVSTTSYEREISSDESVTEVTSGNTVVIKGKLNIDSIEVKEKIDYGYSNNLSLNLEFAYKRTKFDHDILYNFAFVNNTYRDNSFKNKGHVNPIFGFDYRLFDNKDGIFDINLGYSPKIHEDKNGDANLLKADIEKDGKPHENIANKLIYQFSYGKRNFLIDKLSYKLFLKNTHFFSSKYKQWNTENETWIDINTKPYVKNHYGIIMQYNLNDNLSLDLDYSKIRDNREEDTKYVGYNSHPYEWKYGIKLNYAINPKKSLISIGYKKVSSSITSSQWSYRYMTQSHEKDGHEVNISYKFKF